MSSKPEHRLTRDLYWQCHDLYACGLSFQAIKRIVGFSGWTIRNWLLLKAKDPRRFHAIGRKGDKTWYVDNPDPKFRGPFTPEEVGRIRLLLMNRVDTKNGPIMPHMTTRCHPTNRCRVSSRGSTQITFTLDGIVIKTTTNRAVWMLEYGEIAQWYGIYHKCDNPICCNIEHLFTGRESANAQDRDAKGRGNLCAANRVV